MNTKLSDIALIAEVTSAVAVVISLVFVGFQLDANTRATQSATASATNSAMGAWYSATGTNAQASSNFWRGITAPDDLSTEEYYQFALNMHGLMLNLQNSFYLAQNGTLDAQIRSSLTEVIVAVRKQPGLLLYWSQRRAIFLPEFQKYVDELLQAERDASGGLYPDVPSGSEDD